MATLVKLDLESDDDGSYIEAPISSRVVEVGLTAEHALVERPVGDDEEVRIPILVLMPDDEIPDGAQFINVEWVATTAEVCAVYRGPTS